jgi:hypothetical protein
MVLLAASAALGWWFSRPSGSPPAPPTLQVEQPELPNEAVEHESEAEKESADNVVGFGDGSDYNEVERRTSECVRTLKADFDGDGEPEELCTSEVWIQNRLCRTPTHGLQVDLYKGQRWLLHQQLNPGVFWAERFHLVKDLDGDGRAELVTRIELSPDCSGCTAYCVYAFDGDNFFEALNLFGVSPLSTQVGRVLRDYSDIQAHIESRCRAASKRGNPGGGGDDPAACASGSTWLLDSDADGRVEIVQLLDPPAGDYFLKSKWYQLFVMELGQTPAASPHRFHPLEMEGGGGYVGLLGFLKTRSGRVHALINFAHPGTSTAYPILKVFEIRGLGLKQVGELYGFYEHAVPDRLWDVDQDGNTEIIHVASDYWPPGKSHAEVVLNYEIMTYKGGKYVPAGQEISEMAVLREDEDEDE